MDNINSKEALLSYLITLIAEEFKESAILKGCVQKSLLNSSNL